MAIDAQGRDKPRTYEEKAGATFTTVVDEANQLGRLYGFKAIPNGILIDEQGTAQYQKLGGFDIRRTETAGIVEAWAGGSGLAQPSVEDRTAPGDEHAKTDAHFRRGLEFKSQVRAQDAMAEWRKDVELEPDNYVIRKQIWAVENPERFYAGGIDFDWQ